MVAFESLGALSTYLAGNPGVEIVDAPVPLMDFVEVNESAAYKNQPSLRKVVSYISRNTASIPLHLYDRVSDTDRARVVDHPLARVLRAPRPKVTPFEFWRDVINDLLLHDRFCVVHTIDDNDEFVLTRLRPQQFRLIANAQDVVEHVRTWAKDGTVRDLDPDVCIYATGYSLRGANGLSPIETLQAILEESSEAVKYRRTIWKNAARVPLVITRPADKSWTPEGRSRFKATWGAFIAGGGNEGGTPVLEDGMDTKEVNSFRPKDTLDLEGRRLTDAEVASSYFIAPELVGARDGTYSNIDAFRQMLYRDSLGPWITLWEQALNVHLVRYYADDAPGLYAEANLDVKLRGSFEEQAKILQASTGGPWLTRNEARARANLPAIDGADELIVPLNVVEGGQASPQDSAPKEQP